MKKTILAAVSLSGGKMAFWAKKDKTDLEPEISEEPALAQNPSALPCQPERKASPAESAHPPEMMETPETAVLLIQILEMLQETGTRLGSLERGFNEKIHADELQRTLMTEQKNRILQLERNDALKYQKPLAMSILEVYEFARLNSFHAQGHASELLEGVKNICEVALENNSYNIVLPQGKFDAANMSCAGTVATDNISLDGIIDRVKKCGLVYENSGTRSVVRVPQVEIYKYKK